MSLLCYVSICLITLFHRGLQEATTSPQTTGSGNNEDPDASHFLYFAYGSNMLRERLHVRNPSATRVTTGRLRNHTLGFGHWTKNFMGTNSWHGGVATIEESVGEDVWGVVWRMSREHLTSLDNQEGVRRNMYRPLQVSVETEQGEIVCRSYKMNNFTPYLTSPPYKQVVCLGAIQHGLPQDYISKLEALETNGYSGPSVLDTINLKPPAKKAQPERK